MIWMLGREQEQWVESWKQEGDGRVCPVESRLYLWSSFCNGSAACSGALYPAGVTLLIKADDRNLRLSAFGVET